MKKSEFDSLFNLSTEKYNKSRINLLLVIALTAINLILVFAESGTMMLFSATIPYFLFILGYMTPFKIFLVVSFAILAIYLVCWIFSKKHFGFMIAALVMFVIDTLFLAYLYISSQDVSGILDALIHVWVIYYLVTGVIHGIKLNKLKKEIVEDDVIEVEGSEFSDIEKSENQE